MNNQPSVTDWISAISTASGVLVAIIAALLVFIQIRQTTKQMRATSKQLAEDSESTTRPYVFAELVPGMWGDGAFDLKIKNTGKTYARNIALELIEGGFYENENDLITENLKKFMSLPFELAPNSSIRIFFYVPKDKRATPQINSGILPSGKLQLTYEYITDNQSEKKIYQDFLKFDLSILASVMPAPRTGGTRGSGKSHEKSLANINNAIRQATQYIAEINR